MSIVNYMTRGAKTLVKNREGHFSVTVAMLGLPLLLCSGYAIDYNRAHSQSTYISSASDAAALAAVIPANLSEDDRKAYAQKVFDENYFGKFPVKLDINVTREKVEIDAISNVPTLLSAMVGIETIPVKEKSTSLLTTSDVICVLALDPSGDRAIEFLENAKFNSPECSVQANSTSSIAINSEVVTPPMAKSFCTTGVSRGRFDPFVKHACTPIADPYAALTPPPDGVCVDTSDIMHGGGRVMDDAVLSPGTYCSSLTLAGSNITMMPGTYIMKDKSLWITRGARVKGDGVTIIFKGVNSIVEIEDDSDVDLKGPESGPYKGLVFYQSTEGYRSNQRYPSSTSTIIGGSSLKLTGTAYFPTQELVVTSDNPVAAQAPATALIAYKLVFGGQSNTEIHVDHETAGLPPLLPRSDEGARLVK